MNKTDKLKADIATVRANLAKSAENLWNAEDRLVKATNVHIELFQEVSRLEATHSTLRLRLADMLNDLAQEGV